MLVDYDDVVAVSVFAALAHLVCRRERILFVGGNSSVDRGATGSPGHWATSASGESGINWHDAMPTALSAICFSFCSSDSHHSTRIGSATRSMRPLSLGVSADSSRARQSLDCRRVHCAAGARCFDSSLTTLSNAIPVPYLARYVI